MGAVRALTGSGVVIAAAALGAASQLLQAAGFFERFNLETVDLPRISLFLLVPLLVLAVLVLISLLSIGGYLVSNWGFRLTRTRGAATWHLHPRPVHDPRDHPRRGPRRPG